MFMESQKRPDFCERVLEQGAIMLEKAAIEIFYAYASEDEELCKELEKHIRPLIREGLVKAWNHRNITAGTEWVTEIDRHLNTAQIILLLISSDFVASDYCSSDEVERALERHREGTACVIPILLRPVSWKDMPFAKLQVLPKNGKPIRSWESIDDGFVQVVEGIKEAIKEIQSKLVSSPAVPETQPHLEKALSIHGATYPLRKIFCNDYVFSIPLFQRSYAWTTDQAEALLDDLLAFLNESGSEAINEYFLGSIVLIKKESPYARIIDGQQRLTTLTILLAVLRELIPAHAEELTVFLYQKGNQIVGEPNTYRLNLRTRDAEFFQCYIQSEGGIAQLAELDPATLLESQKKMRENALLFLRRLKLLSEEQRFRLANSIVTRCFMVVVSTPSFESAYRIFAVLNDRGLNLTPGDILKAEILGKIPAEKHEDYTGKWEEIEEQLGSEHFQALFADICLIYRKAKLRESVLAEFRKHVQPRLCSSEQFIDEVLSPYADTFYTVKNAAYEVNNQVPIISNLNNHNNQAHWQTDINNLLRWLNLVEHSDWVPAAMFYLVRNQPHGSHLDLLHFLRNLERLTAGLMILRENAHRRIDRFCQILKAIDSGQDLYEANSPLQLTTAECNNILATLDGDVSTLPGALLLYILLRLNAIFSGAQAPTKGIPVTVEQVLPTSSGTSSWLQSFGRSKSRAKYANKLGNMVLLLRKKDPKLSKLDFSEKKRKYLDSGGTLPLAITEQVVKQTEWTPRVIEQRQRMLLEKLQDFWRL